jgi:hypothetical protein
MVHTKRYAFHLVKQSSILTRSKTLYLTSLDLGLAGYDVSRMIVKSRIRGAIARRRGVPCQGITADVAKSGNTPFFSNRYIFLAH